ncbi:MAG: rRNA maturation RNase YbeY [Cyanobacteriota bacterium]|nr:rRNA maturation RNase YbeY [Cyanobacteriota bacterium]
MKRDRGLPLAVEVHLQDRWAAREENPISQQQWREWFQCWLEALSVEVPPAESYELTLRLTDDAEIQQLNAQYRQQNRPTDVLAFAAMEVDLAIAEGLEDEPFYLGDLVISVETARSQAREREHSISTELAWLATHGFLHLLGWDHPDETQLQRMLKQQRQLLSGIGLNIEFE